MSMRELSTVNDLLYEVVKTELYTKLIEQLNKDMARANIDLQFADDVLPTSLKLVLQEKIYKLIQGQFMDYLNLLYIIDVSEEKIKKLDGDDVLQLSHNVTFLILEREWYKVYFRNKFRPEK